MSTPAPKSDTPLSDARSTVPTEKRCYMCRLVKPSDVFHLCSHQKDGLSTWCKPCKAEYSKRCRKAPTDSDRRRNIQWRERNRQRTRDYAKAYASSHQEERRSRAKIYRESNRDLLKMKAEARKLSGEISRYYRERRKTDEAFRMTCRLRSRIRSALLRSVGKKSLKTEELIGCSIAHFKAHIESLFLEGMSWDNARTWHIDHIIPCARFNLKLPEEQKKCFHFKNLRPLWALENITKGARHPEDSK